MQMDDDDDDEIKGNQTSALFSALTWACSCYDATSHQVCFQMGAFFLSSFFLLGKQPNASSSQNEWLVMAGADVEEECFFLLPYGSWPC